MNMFEGIFFNLLGKSTEICKSFFSNLLSQTSTSKLVNSFTMIPDLFYTRLQTHERQIQTKEQTTSKEDAISVLKSLSDPFILLYSSDLGFFGFFFFSFYKYPPFSVAKVLFVKHINHVLKMDISLET